MPSRSCLALFAPRLKTWKEKKRFDDRRKYLAEADLSTPRLCNMEGRSQTDAHVGMANLLEPVMVVVACNSHDAILVMHLFPYFLFEKEKGLFDIPIGMRQCDQAACRTLLNEPTTNS